MSIDQTATTVTRAAVVVILLSLMLHNLIAATGLSKHYKERRHNSDFKTRYI